MKPTPAFSSVWVARVVFDMAVRLALRMCKDCRKLGPYVNRSNASEIFPRHCFQIVPECLGEAAGDEDLVVVRPRAGQKHRQVPDHRRRGTADRKEVRMEVQAHALGQHPAHGASADEDSCAGMALVENIRLAGKRRAVG